MCERCGLAQVAANGSGTEAGIQYKTVAEGEGVFRCPGDAMPRGCHPGPTKICIAKYGAAQ